MGTFSVWQAGLWFLAHLPNLSEILKDLRQMCKELQSPSQYIMPAKMDPQYISLWDEAFLQDSLAKRTHSHSKCKITRNCFVLLLGQMWMYFKWLWVVIIEIWSLGLILLHLNLKLSDFWVVFEIFVNLHNNHVSILQASLMLQVICA